MRWPNSGRELNLSSEADVCLVLEGTYPYVSGGVSSWVHQLIGAMPDLKFVIWFIGSSSKDKREPKYELPPNVLGMREVFVHDYDMPGKEHFSFPSRRKKEVWEKVKAFHRSIRQGKVGPFEEVFWLTLPHRGILSLEDMFYGKDAWRSLLKLYREVAPEVSFVDFFWTWRFTHLPFFRMLLMEPPKAKVYHTVSTGYAGFLGTLAKLRYGKPLILTEHGIYAKERRIEIAQAEWIYEQEEDRRPWTYRGGELRPRGTRWFFKDFWTRIFLFMSRLTYRCRLRR